MVNNSNKQCIAVLSDFTHILFIELGPEVTQPLVLIPVESQLEPWQPDSRIHTCNDFSNSPVQRANCVRNSLKWISATAPEFNFPEPHSPPSHLKLRGNTRTYESVKVLVAQLRSTLCDPWTVARQASLPMGFRIYVTQLMACVPGTVLGSFQGTWSCGLFTCFFRSKELQLNEAESFFSRPPC